MQNVSSTVSEPAAGSLSPNRSGKIIKFLFPLLFLFLRPDLRRKTQRKRLAEMLQSEYSSGMEAGVATVRKQKKDAEPGGQPHSAV